MTLLLQSQWMLTGKYFPFDKNSRSEFILSSVLLMVMLGTEMQEENLKKHEALES